MSVRRAKAAVPFVLVCVFIDVLGFGLIIPALPGLIAQFVLDRQAQAHWYGILGASYGLMQFVAAPLLGALSDRFGRRPVLLVSIFGLGCDFLMVALSPSLAFILVARLIGGATAASFSVSAAYVADVTTESERAAKMGLIGAAFGLGFVFGPAIGGLLGNVNLRLPYFVAAGLSACNFIYGYLVLPESLPKERRSALVWSKVNPFAAVFNIVRLKGVGPLVVVITLMTLADFILRSVWVLFTTFRFDYTPRQNGLALLAVGLTAALVQGLLMGPILKRVGETRSVLVGLFSSFVAFLAFGLVLHGWMMYPIIFLEFMAYVAGPTLQGIISRNVDPAAQGITMGALNGLFSIMAVAAPLIGTAAIAAVAHLPTGDVRVGSPFYLAAVLQLVALVIAWRFFQHRRVALKAT